MGNQAAGRNPGSLHATAGQDIVVIVNGEKRSVGAGATVSSLLAELGLKEDRVAVELDRVIVRRSEWGSTELGPLSRHSRH